MSSSNSALGVTQEVSLMPISEWEMNQVDPEPSVNIFHR